MEKHLPSPFVMVNTFEDVQRVAKMFAASGYFRDVKDLAQAGVKIIAGLELGIPPMAAMRGIHVLEGKIILSGNIMAGLVRRHPDYDYQVKHIGDDGCTLEFYYKGDHVGTSMFGPEDAKKAGLKGINYQKYPRNMYFNRALSNGVRWYCPDVFQGNAVYTFGEFEETEVVVEAEDPPQMEESNLRPDMRELKPVQRVMMAYRECGFNTNRSSDDHRLCLSISMHLAGEALVESHTELTGEGVRKILTVLGDVIETFNSSEVRRTFLWDFVTGQGLAIDTQDDLLEAYDAFQQWSISEELSLFAEQA